MRGLYILDGKTPIEVPDQDFLEWAMVHEVQDNIVGRTQIEDILVSTIFLGLDQSFMRSKPLLFETMIFGGEHDGYQVRYETWNEAAIGHVKACEMVVSV